MYTIWQRKCKFKSDFRCCCKKTCKKKELYLWKIETVWQAELAGCSKTTCGMIGSCERTGNVGILILEFGGT